MQKYQVLEHTADLKIKAFGKDKEELFENALLGMFGAAKYESETSSKVVKRKVKLDSTDISSLLIDFLNEVLYLSETNWEIYESVEFEKFSKKEIEAVLIGRKLNKVGVQIKAATYHSLNLREREDGLLEAIVLFDV